MPAKDATTNAMLKIADLVFKLMVLLLREIWGKIKFSDNEKEITRKADFVNQSRMNLNDAPALPPLRGVVQHSRAVFRQAQDERVILRLDQPPTYPQADSVYQHRVSEPGLRRVRPHAQHQQADRNQPQIAPAAQG
jgi:hypothetical protein